MIGEGWRCPARARAKIGTWTVGQFVVAQKTSVVVVVQVIAECEDEDEDVEGARRIGGRKGRAGRKIGGRRRRLRESPYSCHPEFLDGGMTSLSSYGFVFGSADSIGTSEGSLGTFLLDPTSFAGRRADGDARLNIRYVDGREFLFQRSRARAGSLRRRFYLGGFTLAGEKNVCEEKKIISSEKSSEKNSAF